MQPSFVTKMLSTLALAVIVVSLGCSRTSQQERIIPLKASASLENARSVLQNYANGAPVTSEAAGFDPMVEGVRKEDPASADILQDAFSKIKANPASRVAVAKKALEELPEKPAAPSEE